MWWSKQTQSAEPAFSPAFSSTGVMDAPAEPPASQPSRAPSSTGPCAARNPKEDMACSDDLYLDAVIDGAFSLNCRRLTIGQRAKANADVVAQEMIIYGKLAGNLEAADRIEIKKHASVTGKLITRRILIEDGAYFKGTLQIERRRQPRHA